MLAQIAFPTASYLVSRSHLVRLLALCLLVAVALPLVAMVASAVVPLVLSALWAAVVVAAPVVAWGVAIFGGMYAGLLAVVRL